jgi:cell division septation protein DedD
MGKSTKRRPIEIRFSPLSLLCLFFIWVGVSGLAFYVGILVGRMEQMREIRRVYRADESVVAEEELPVLSFEESLTAPDEQVGAGRPSVTVTPKARPAEALPKPAAEDGQTGIAVLQIASFREPERAEHLVRELRKKGYRCFHRASEPSGGDGGYCRVFVGPLPSVEMAEEVKKRLEQGEGYRDILIRSVGKKEENF